MHLYCMLQVNKLSAALEDLSDEAVLLRRKAGLPQESTLDTSGVKLQKDVTIAQLRSVNALLERQVRSMGSAELWCAVLLHMYRSGRMLMLLWLKWQHADDADDVSLLYEPLVGS